MAVRPIVGVARCDAGVGSEAVLERLTQAAEHLGDLGRLFAGKRKVFIKSNLGVMDLQRLEGRMVALTNRDVVRATVKLIRDHFDGELLIGDGSTFEPCRSI